MGWIRNIVTNKPLFSYFYLGCVQNFISGSSQPVLEIEPVIKHNNVESFRKFKHTLKYIKICMFDIVNINPTTYKTCLTI